MVDANCLHCASSNLQSVPEMVESQTEVIYDNPPGKVPRIRELLIQGEKIYSQSQLAQQLTQLEIPPNLLKEVNQSGLTIYLDQEELEHLKAQKNKQIKTHKQKMINKGIFLSFVLLVLLLFSWFFLLLIVGIIILLIFRDYYNFIRKTRAISTLNKLIKFNQKINLWSNLYYCHDCSYIMEFDYQVSDQVTNLNYFINSLLNQNQQQE